MLAGLLPLLLAQRWLHHELQLVLLLLTRRPKLALGIFALLFFPGVLLHELSHLLMAILLRVPTGKFSLIPQITPDGQLQLGSVQTAAVDFFRDALIGAAPLLSGGAAIVYLGINRLGLLSLSQLFWSGQPKLLLHTLSALPNLPDFWIWFYLAFTISSTMLPSPSDRRAWLPLVLVLTVLTGLALLAGAGPWMLLHLAPGLNQFLHGLALVFGFSLALHLVLLFPLAGFRFLLQRLVKSS